MKVTFKDLKARAKEIGATVGKEGDGEYFCRMAEARHVTTYYDDAEGVMMQLNYYAGEIAKGNKAMLM